MATAAPPSSTLSSSPYMESLYGDWKKDPTSVPESWHYFFQGFDLSLCGRDCVATVRANAQFRVVSLIDAYRRQGHLAADLDPLSSPLPLPDLAPENFGFKAADLDATFDTADLAGAPPRATLGSILAILRDTYTRTVGVEYAHVQDPRIRAWLQSRMEPVRNRPRVSREQRLEILDRLVDAEILETFIHTRYRGQKRFSLEGAETLIAAMHAVLERAPDLGIEEIVLGMAHRGRLNVLANILDKSYGEIFAEFEGNTLPDSPWGDGDVKYHKGYSSDHVNRSGRRLHVSLTANPSHLEAVGPVAQGRARAKQGQRGDSALRKKVLPFLIHGDAAFAGQGIVAEAFNLSQLPGYSTGGTVHFVVNNRIGFTTTPEEARSTRYATDVARMVDAPVFHVNGDDPEATCFVTLLALEFRQVFGRDVVVDMICYRRHGHNEGDEPEFTQPALYRRIKDRPPVRRLYQARLLEEGLLSPTEDASIGVAFQARLERVFREVHDVPAVFQHNDAFQGRWEGMDHPWTEAVVETGVPHALLSQVADALCTVPEGFALNPKVARVLPLRLAALRDRTTVDWSFAELLAFGSLAREGMGVRLSGQDSARGTFSQRHSVWHDHDADTPYTPLNHIHPEQARFCVYNSALSEAAVLGFDYGYSLAEPHMLILWEAQFGDFANGAQVIFDTFIGTARARWGRASGIVMLLPHGHEGQGPDHSNASIERYLAACADDNIQVCIPSTPSQYFHALRRQMYRPYRLPLVLFTPKSLLRHPLCRSTVEELIAGHFHEVLDDPGRGGLPPDHTLVVPRRLLLCSGKVSYDLLEAREKSNLRDVAIVRIEQFHPWPAEGLGRTLARYKAVESVAWVQEESENRGAWPFVRDRLAEALGRPLEYVGRPPSPSPATGSLRIHRKEQEDLVQTALHGKTEEAGGVP